MNIIHTLGAFTITLAAVEAGYSKESDNNTPVPLVVIPETEVDASLKTLQFSIPSTKHPDNLSPTIPFDKICPFEMAQPSDARITEKAAIKFRPQVTISQGCYPHAAVNEAGQISKGLQAPDPTYSKCGDPVQGTQVYGRSAWFGRVWAIMYAWYFPDSPIDWQHAIVWTNNPNVSSPVILAVTVTDSKGEYSSKVSPDIDGKTTKLIYKNRGLDLTDKDGECQNLVLWHQLTVDAQEKLNDDKSFGDTRVPFNDDYFLLSLGKAWPFPENY